MTIFAWGFFNRCDFSVSVADIRDPNIFLRIDRQCLRSAFTLSASQIYVIERSCWFVKINFFFSISSTWESCSVLIHTF